MNSRGKRQASTLVETAFCLVLILLPLTLGILQFGIIINASHSLQQIVRDAGRFAAVHGKETTFDKGATQTNPPSLFAFVKDACDGTSIKYTDIKTITVTPSSTNMSDRISGQPISVTIVYPMTKKSFLGTNSSYLPWLKVLFKDTSMTSTFVLE